MEPPLATVPALRHEAGKQTGTMMKSDRRRQVSRKQSTISGDGYFQPADDPVIGSPGDGDDDLLQACGRRRREDGGQHARSIPVVL